MELEDFVKAVAMLVVIPLFFWLRVRAINKRKKGATVRCPHCSKDQRLAILGNYFCQSCDKEVCFFDEKGDQLTGKATYQCAACDEQNLVGVLTCQACGLANPQAVSNQQR